MDRFTRNALLIALLGLIVGGGMLGYAGYLFGKGLGGR